MSIQLVPKMKRTAQSTPVMQSGTGNTLPQFVQFINKLEGWKTKCKNLHWAASENNVHVRLDEFLDIISDYQDTVAEGIMGVLNTHLGPNDVKGDPGTSTDAMMLVQEVKNETLNFYANIPQDPIYAGLKSECETFIQNINKYSYLFSLCECKNKK